MRGGRLAGACGACAAVLAAALTGCAPPRPAVVVVGPRADALLRVEAARRLAAFLADPALGGRMVGTPGNRRAGDYLAGQFAAAALTPAEGRGGDGAKPEAFFQSIPVPCIRPAGPASSLRAAGDAFGLHHDFSPLAAGRAGEFDGPLAFAGFGRRNAAAALNDYRGLDAAGAVVLVLWGTRAGTKPRSAWDAKGAKARDAVLAAKLADAADAGAAAVLIVSADPTHVIPPLGPAARGGTERGARPSRGRVFYGVLGEGDGRLPAMNVSRRAADRLLAAAGRNTTVARLARTARKRAASFRTSLRVAGRADLEPGRGRNVVGILPATHPRGGRDAVVIGAHYDHLSVCGARARDAGAGVRPGADDNASGVAALVLLARALAAVKRRTLTYVFIAFDGEEYGFNGSRHYVSRPAAAIERTMLMINLDQIGRLGRNGLSILGSVGREPFRTALRAGVPRDRAYKLYKLPITSRHRWSDQAAFERAGVPTLFFFTGFHGQYHRMTDTLDRLDVSGVVTIARVVFRTLLHLDRS